VQCASSWQFTFGFSICFLFVPLFLSVCYILAFSHWFWFALIYHLPTWCMWVVCCIRAQLLLWLLLLLQLQFQLHWTYRNRTISTSKGVQKPNHWKATGNDDDAAPDPTPNSKLFLLLRMLQSYNFKTNKFMLQAKKGSPMDESQTLRTANCKLKTENWTKPKANKSRSSS